MVSSTVTGEPKSLFWLRMLALLTLNWKRRGEVYQRSNPSSTLFHSRAPFKMLPVPEPDLQANPMLKFKSERFVKFFAKREDEKHILHVTLC